MTSSRTSRWSWLEVRFKSFFCSRFSYAPPLALTRTRTHTRTHTLSTYSQVPMSKSGAHDFDYRNVEPITDTTAGYGRKQMFRAFEPVAKTVEVSKRRERSRATEEKKKRAPLLGRRIPIPRGRPLSKVALPMRPWSPPKNSRRTPTIDDEDMWRRD